MRDRSWHAQLACPSFEQLARVELSHWNFQGGVTIGTLIVARELATEIAEIFEELFLAHFEIARMRPVCHYGGDDEASMADNNSSAFNCRLKLGSATELSAHAHGRAIDLNPIQNPYETRAGWLTPAAGAEYSRRKGELPAGPGVLLADGIAVQSFEKRGWVWGGRWSDPMDWHHFEKPLPDSVATTESAADAGRAST